MSRKPSKLLSDQRGQAMVEYTSITFLLLVGVAGVTFAGFAVKGDQMGHTVTLAQALYSSLQVYVDSFYFSLHLLAP